MNIFEDITNWNVNVPIKKKRIIKKKCNECKQFKDVNEFYYYNLKKRYYTKCKECFDKISKKRSEIYKENNLKKGDNVYNKNKYKYCSKCKKKYLRTNEYWSKNITSKDGLSLHCKKCNQLACIKTIYNLTEKQLNKLISYQNNRCAICNKEFDPQLKEPCIDHDHKIEKETGIIKIRGLLCQKHNQLLGYLERSIRNNVLDNSLKYIKNNGIEGLEEILKEDEDV